MTTPNGAEEKTLYETIVEIPHYQCKYHSTQKANYYFATEKRISLLLDKEDEEMVVEDSLEAF